AGMDEARAAGWVDHFGLTGIGDADALTSVMQSRRFATIQAPFHILNPSALRTTPAAACDPDYGGFLRTAAELGMGIFAIRVYAAGALLGAEPSAHTLKTPFFPLNLYRRDAARTRQLAQKHGSMQAVREAALRYVLSQTQIASAIVGFGAVEHVDDAVRIARMKSLSEDELREIERG
ncbi:MAG: aldo/keto reductase, partial [Acidobacteriota bacterium]|nr:aldo/keto reductase [Acidobacteriota bacterium]